MTFQEEEKGVTFLKNAHTIKVSVMFFWGACERNIEKMSMFMSAGSEGKGGFCLR